MMNNFDYVKAGSLSEAFKALSTRGTRVHAGGTDLLGCARDGIMEIEKVVSISGIKELKGITTTPDGGLKIGALTSLAEVASSNIVVQKYRALAQSAAAVGTPQIREQGTLGGNICQRPRCWYFRGNFQCRKKGGQMCYAFGGENQYHAIFGGGPCFFVHPSDTAVALVALQAQVRVARSSGSRTVRMENFFVGPDKFIDKENILLGTEILTEVLLPPFSGEFKSAYRKIATRGSWDFALASVAVVLQLEGGSIRSAGIVLGGVAPSPWRAGSAEKLLTGKKLDRSLAAAAGEEAVNGARPLRDNSYKVDMVRGAVEEVLVALM